MGRSVAPLTRRLLAAALVAAAAGAAAVGLLLRDDETIRGGGYQLRYDVEDLTTHARTTELVEIDRPLRSRRLTGQSGSATTERGVFERLEGRWRQVAVTPPGEVGQDMRLSASLAWAEEHRLAKRDGTAVVAGRRCTWWLTKEPVDIAAVAPSTPADRARSCVDEDGLLLADTWRSGGRDLRRRTATEIRRTDRLDVFDGASPAPLASELILTVVEQLSRPVDDLVTLAPPPGMSLRATCRWSDLEPGTSDVSRRAVRAVYADDRDLLVVDQIRGRVDPRGLAVPLPGFETGYVQATGGGLLVTVPLSTDQALRVRTSLSYDALLAWLAAVHRR